MIKVAIVGNIASGKSSVEKILTQRGYKVLDTDCVCHRLLTEIEDIKVQFKNFDVFDNSGEISREKLGKLVFDNVELKVKLENILYPIVRVEINHFFENNTNEKYLFVAVPLLFEAKMEDLFDKILFIYCDDFIRLNRLMARNNYDKTYALKRLNSQISQEKKLGKADYVIENNSDIQSLESKVSSFLFDL